MNREVTGTLSTGRDIAKKGEVAIFFDREGGKSASAIGARADRVEKFFLWMQAQEAGIFVGRGETEIAECSGIVIEVSEVDALAITVRACADVKRMNGGDGGVGGEKPKCKKCEWCERFHGLRNMFQAIHEGYVEEKRMGEVMLTKIVRVMSSLVLAVERDG